MESFQFFRPLRKVSKHGLDFFQTSYKTFVLRYEYLKLKMHKRLDAYMDNRTLLCTPARLQSLIRYLVSHARARRDCDQQRKIGRTPTRAPYTIVILVSTPRRWCILDECPLLPGMPRCPIKKKNKQTPCNPILVERTNKGRRPRLFVWSSMVEYEGQKFTSNGWSLQLYLFAIHYISKETDKKLSTEKNFVKFCKLRSWLHSLWAMH